MPKKIKSVLAILAGFIAITALSLGADMIFHSMQPHRFNRDGGTTDATVLMVAIFYSAASGVMGCYFTARLSPQKPKIHAMILLLSIFANIANWKTAPAWYHIIALVLILPAAWIGDEMRERQLERQK